MKDRYKRLLQNNPMLKPEIVENYLIPKQHKQAKTNADLYKDAMANYQYHLKASKSHRKY